MSILQTVCNTNSEDFPRFQRASDYMLLMGLFVRTTRLRVASLTTPSPRSSLGAFSRSKLPRHVAHAFSPSNSGAHGCPLETPVPGLRLWHESSADAPVRNTSQVTCNQASKAHAVWAGEPVFSFDRFLYSTVHQCLLWVLLQFSVPGSHPKHPCWLRLCLEHFRHILFGFVATDCGRSASFLVSPDFHREVGSEETTETNSIERKVSIMGYLVKIKGSSYWQARFINESNVEVQRSTKSTNRADAETKLNTWSLAAQLLRSNNLSKYRTRYVVAEMSKLLSGDTSSVATVASYCDGFLLNSKALTYATYHNRKPVIKAFRAFLNGDVLMPLEDVVNPHIVGFRDCLLKQGQTPATVKQRLEVLNTLFAQAVTDKVIKHNPCAGVLVKQPKAKHKAAQRKRKALSFEDGVKLVDAAKEVEELVAIVVGLDLAARIGDAFGLDLTKIDLQTGRVSYWVEKADEWHAVDFFPDTVSFLQEYVACHRPKTDSPLLMPSIGLIAGPDSHENERRSKLQGALKGVAALVERAGLGEWMTNVLGSRHNTVRYHCFRITCNNSLKMAGISTEWIMARMCQKSKKANEAYDRRTADNIRTAVFGKLGIAANGMSNSEPATTDGSMTVTEMMQVINYAREKLVAIRMGGKLATPSKQLSIFD